MAISAAKHMEVLGKVMTEESGDNKRKDAGKPNGFYLIPPDALTELAKVYAIGAKKYSPRGWEAGMEWSRVLDPMFRHILAWQRGQTHDPTDGQHHLASVAWAALALMEYERTHPELDDVHAARTEPDYAEIERKIDVEYNARKAAA
jgi:hypothetical protein